MISSTSNEHVRQVCQLQRKSRIRRKEGLFVAEGLRMVCETPAELVREIYVSERFLAEHGEDRAYRDFLDSLEAGRNQNRKTQGGQTGPLEVSDPVMEYMSDTVTPQGILAVVRQPAYQWEELLGGHKTLLMILENIQDPGNLGTIFRTAEGAGATGILMSRDTVDLFSPKVIRSTMGSLYRVPWLITEDLSSCLKRAREAGICLYAADLQAKCDYDQADCRTACGFLIGNEGSGLRDATAALAEVRIRIPMEGRLESLNAAMAAGILMYEAARQRRRG